MPNRYGHFIVSDLHTLLGLRQVDIACKKCKRIGRVSVARVIREHGADTTLPDVAHLIAHDCPRLRSVSLYDRCGATLPNVGEAINTVWSRMQARRG